MQKREYLQIPEPERPNLGFTSEMNSLLWTGPMAAPAVPHHCPAHSCLFGPSLAPGLGEQKNGRLLFARCSPCPGDQPLGPGPSVC